MERPPKRIEFIYEADSIDYLADHIRNLNYYIDYLEVETEDEFKIFEDGNINIENVNGYRIVRTKIDISKCSNGCGCLKSKSAKGELFYPRCQKQDGVYCKEEKSIMEELRELRKDMDEPLEEIEKQ